MHEKPWVRRRLHVPKDNRALFARPDLESAESLVGQNREMLDGSPIDLQGRSLQRLRHWTRDAVLEAARQYTSELRGESIEPLCRADGPLIVGGHQPSLFHPGVWAKNFAVGRLAGRTGGIGLHLIVDNDTMAGTRVVVPGGTRQTPLFETLPLDADRPAQPWEEARVVDPSLLASFGQRAEAAMARWNIRPMASEYWGDAVQGGERTCLLRDAFTTLRHCIERRWGLSNLELPLSRVGHLEPFHWFVAHILAQLPRFRETHNTVLREYRRINRVRSRTHPVADLRKSDEWLEAPFWVWRAGDSMRGRLHARQSGRQVILSDGREELARLKLAPDMEACCAVEELRELAQRGIRLRTRALTTTLFARLLLADLFVHGIGGAKYDEMTDRILSRFYGVTPPEFLTVSATVHLPIGPSFNVTVADTRRLEGLLRDLHWNAERHLTPGLDSAIDALMEEKSRLAGEQREDDVTPVVPGTRRRRHRARADRCRRFRELARLLESHARDQEHSARSELAALRSQLKANRILQSRDYAFPLYAEETLRPFLCGL